MNITGEKKENNIKKLGFTIIETLVAVSILSISILAGFTAVRNGLNASINAKDQMIAFYLIQDAMEYIKNVRDENALKFINGEANTWLTGLSEVLADPCYFGKTCYVDSPANTATYCGVGGNAACPFIKRDSVSGLMGYNAGWTATNFKRAISFQSVSADEIVVTIWMSWTQGFYTKSFQVSQTVFNHQ